MRQEGNLQSPQAEAETDNDGVSTIVGDVIAADGRHDG